MKMYDFQMSTLKKQIDVLQSKNQAPCVSVTTANLLVIVFNDVT